MILTDKLKLRKPEQEDFIDVDDINHNTDIIDDVLGDGNKHVVSKLLSKEGVHGLRVIKRTLQVFDKGKWKTITGNGGVNYVPPADMRKFNAVIFERNKVKLAFLEPLDTMLEDDIVSKVAGVMIRYSTEKYPENIDEGILAINNLELGKYENEPFILPLKYDKTYYFTAFPYSDMELYNTTVTNKNRLMIKTEEIEAVAPNNMRKFNAVPNGDGVLLTFLEPEDTIIDGEIASKVAGVMIRYSSEKYPESITEGVLAIDNKELGKYANTGFEIKGLDHLKTYYFSAFIYSDKGLYNAANMTENRCRCTPLGIEKVSIISNVDCSVDIIINSRKEYIELIGNVPYSFDVDKGVAYTIIPKFLKARYKTPDKIVKVAEAGKTNNINLIYEKIKTLNDYSWSEIIQLHSQGKLAKIWEISKNFEQGYKQDDDYGQRWRLVSVSGNQAFFFLENGSPVFITKVLAPYGASGTDKEDVQGVAVYGKDGNNITIIEDKNATSETDKLPYKIANHFKDYFPTEIRNHVKAYGISKNNSLDELAGKSIYAGAGYIWDYNFIKRDFIYSAYIYGFGNKTEIKCTCRSAYNGASHTYSEEGTAIRIADNTLIPFRLVLTR